MGVLKAPRKSVKIEDFVPEFDYRDFAFSDESDYESDTSEDSIDPATRQAIQSAIQQNYRRRRKPRFSRRCGAQFDPFGMDGVNLKSNSGRHKRRRVEHAQNILSLCDPDDIVKDFSDIVPQVETAFSKLFLDHESMAKWQALAELEADEQERIIEEMDRQGPSTLSDDEYEHVLGGSPMKLPKNYDRLSSDEKRNYHPVHSANARFRKLTNKAKSMLSKRRGVPYDLLDEVEHKLRDFFNATPTGVWIDVIDNPHTRMFYHSVAAFLDLVSTTLEDETGQKFLEIRNKKAIFIAPYQYLVKYLHQRNNGRYLSSSE